MSLREHHTNRNLTKKLYRGDATIMYTCLRVLRKVLKSNSYSC